MKLNIINPARDREKNGVNYSYHCRLYNGSSGPCVVEIHDDYQSWDAGQFLNYDTYTTREEAEEALREELLRSVLVIQAFKDAGQELEFPR